MGQIFVEGLGVVEIEGESPNERESAAIVSALQPQQETAEPVTQQAEARTITRGEFARSRVREEVQQLPPVGQFAAEITPATAGGVIGGVLGAPFVPPFGVVAGAAAGGLLGEFLAQKAGIAPESKTNLAITGAAPVAGAALGGGIKLGKRAIGKSLEAIPPVRSALANIAEQEGAQELSTLGGRILANQKGLQTRSADDLFRVARKEGITISPSQLNNTRQMLGKVNDDLAKLADFPEGQQAIALVDRITASLGEEAVSFDTLLTVRQLVGSAVSRAERAGGIRLGSTKQLFKALSDDIDQLAKGAGATRRQARVAQAANQRAKLEFSVRELEENVAKFTTPVRGGEGVRFNVEGLRKELLAVTNPKSPKFNKNFTEALKDELPDIQKRLDELARLTQGAGSPAGRGSIVVRGITAATGGAVGGFIAGTPGAAVGALVGASGPDAMASIFMSPRASALLRRAVDLGKGEISASAWANITQILARSAAFEPSEKTQEVTEQVRNVR